MKLRLLFVGLLIFIVLLSGCVSENTVRQTSGNMEPTIKKGELVNIEKNIGEINIGYNTDITKTPGVFATMANELAINNISVVDSMICHSEHIIIVKEKDIKKAFGVVYNIIVGRQ